MGGGAVAAVGSNNSVQYNNGGALGGSGMTYISSTDYLGIGQSAPSAKLEVNGTASATTVNTGKVLFADGTSQTTKAYTQCTTVSAGFAANAYGSVSCPAGYTLIAGGYSCACGNGCMAASTYPRAEAVGLPARASITAEHRMAAPFMRSAAADRR